MAAQTKAPLSLGGTDWTILNCQLKWKRLSKKGNLYKYCHCHLHFLQWEAVFYHHSSPHVWLQDCNHPFWLQHHLGALGELNLMFLHFVHWSVTLQIQVLLQHNMCRLPGFDAKSLSMTVSCVNLSMICPKSSTFNSAFSKCSAWSLVIQHR